ESGPARLVVAPERGGRIMALSVDGLDLLVTPDVDDYDFGCFPMAPWAGRIRHRSFVLEGERYQPPLNNPPHAIPGTAPDHPWSRAATVTLETSCPCVLVFTEPEPAICVEPQSHPPDAFNLGPAVARPGEPVVATATWSWQVGNG